MKLFIKKNITNLSLLNGINNLINLISNNYYI